MDGVGPGAFDADEAGEAVRHAQAELERAVREGNLTKDPMRLPLGALAVTLGAQHQLHVAQVRQSRAIIDQMNEAIGEARAPVDPAALVRLEEAAATGADRRAATLARAHNWRTVLLAAGALVGALAIGGVGGFWFGWNSQIATASRIEAAALRDGPDAAATWLGFMQANDGRVVKSACAAGTAVTDGGRKACALGLWVEPPANSGPRTVPAK